MPAIGSVEVSITNLEPLKTFLQACTRVANEFLAMTPAEAASLPDRCASGIAEFQDALQELGMETGLVREVA